MSVWQKIASICVLAVLLVSQSVVSAHEIRPAIADFDVVSSNSFQLSLKLNLESWLAGIGEEHSDTNESPQAKEYEQLRALSSTALNEQFSSKIDQMGNEISIEVDGRAVELKYLNAQIPETGDVALARDSVIQFSGKLPENAQNLVWRFGAGASVFRMPGYNGNEKTALYVASNSDSDPVDLTGARQPDLLGQFVSYIKVGFDHIIPKGLDHILFVIGLYLLSTRWSALLWQITAFTLAHTITLGLAMAGYISLPASIVEPLIAASIVYIAVENMLTDRLSRWRPFVVFGFGLLHGLGFAGVLKEFGLGSGGFIAGLIGFNIGVELGQLAVIAICFLTFGLWFGKRQWYHSRVTVPLSILIAAFGALWFYERVFLA